MSSLSVIGYCSHSAWLHAKVLESDHDGDGDDTGSREAFRMIFNKTLTCTPVGNQFDQKTKQFEITQENS